MRRLLATCTLGNAAVHSGVVYCKVKTPLARAIRVTLMMVDGDGTVTAAVVARRED